MAVPVVVGYGTWAPGTLLTLHKANIPIVPDPGDLILVQWGRAGATGVGALETGTINFQSLIAQAGAGGVNIGSRLAYAVAVGNETTGDKDFCTISSDRGGSQTWIIRGWSGDVPAVGTMTQQLADATHDPPSLTSGFGAVDQMWFALNWLERGYDADSTQPSGWGALDSPGLTGGTVSLYASKLTSANATENPGVFTHDAAIDGYVTTIAIKGARRPHSFGSII